MKWQDWTRITYAQVAMTMIPTSMAIRLRLVSQSFSIRPGVVPTCIRTRSQADAAHVYYGTPGWRAPEITARLGFGPESDLYAAGLVAVFVYSGQRLVDPDDQACSAWKIVDGTD
eukprot:TRINITY_DN12598_c0_g1_i2.p2 TRINITY_DN12598_c0_g1~~TRINITY_DN12598_c0_g1_i2.p2  ORF type:complete len:115 (+),score=0.21 TRINITY_DN12598_c0_g1_i2:94-438(+)